MLLFLALARDVSNGRNLTKAVVVLACYGVLKIAASVVGGGIGGLTANRWPLAVT